MNVSYWKEMVDWMFLGRLKVCKIKIGESVLSDSVASWSQMLNFRVNLYQSITHCVQWIWMTPVSDLPPFSGTKPRQIQELLSVFFITIISFIVGLPRIVDSLLGHRTRNHFMNIISALGGGSLSVCLSLEASFFVPQELSREALGN